VRIAQFVLSVALALALTARASAAPRQAEILDLGDGYQFELIAAGDTKASVAHPKTIYVNVALKNEKLHADHKKLIEAADRLFESVLMGAAEKGYYSEATVNIRKPGTAAAPAYEDFLYLRGDNEVWLRQAGNVPWKVAQETKWTPPEAENVEVDGFGSFAVEAAVEIDPPEGFKRAAEIDFVTKTPVIDIQRKYQEVKALWAHIDREHMKADGFDIVLFGNFAEAQRGRFHARKGFFVRIPRAADGDWPELPERVPDDRDYLISKLEVPSAEVTEAIRMSFAGGTHPLRLASLIVPGSPAASARTFTQVGFAPGAAVTMETKRVALVPAAKGDIALAAPKPARVARARCHLKCIFVRP
jgi:hypothetical protein